MLEERNKKKRQLRKRSCRIKIKERKLWKESQGKEIIEKSEGKRVNERYLGKKGVEKNIGKEIQGKENRERKLRKEN